MFQCILHEQAEPKIPGFPAAHISCSAKQAKLPSQGWKEATQTWPGWFLDLRDTQGTNNSSEVKQLKTEMSKQVYSLKP